MAADVMTAVVDEQAELKQLLDQWHRAARELWEITAIVGQRLEERYRAIPSERWAQWLSEVGLTPFQAFLFMRATRYPELMNEHRPMNLTAINRLLPQKQGEAFDAEQAEMARRMFEAGMSREQLRLNMGASPMTLTRWLDPEAHAIALQKQADRHAKRRDAMREEKRRRREAALRAKGGPGALAYQHLRRAAVALDEAWRAELDKEAKRAYSAALTAIYAAEDKVVRAEGIR
jgi:hypothetical protein